MKTISIILVAVCTVICGQLLLKSGMLSIGRISNFKPKETYKLLKKILTHKKIILGFMLYGLSSLLWIYILSFTDLSYAYPFLSIAYVGVPFAATLILKEKIFIAHWLGITMVMLGIILIAKS